MALKTRGPRKEQEAKPLEELGDEQIREHVTLSRARLNEILSLPRNEILRMDMKALSGEVSQLHGAIEGGEQLLDHRRARDRTEDWLSQSLEVRRALKEQEREREKRMKAREPLVRAIQFVAKAEHYALRDARLSIEALCAEDRHPSEAGRELVELVRRIRSQEPLPSEERARYEFLVGISCGNPQVFQHAREQKALKAEARELASKIKVAALDRRPRWEEPGSVTLPRFAVHDWLLGDGAREGDWSLMDLGLLVAVIAAFENRDPSYFVGARFEGEGDERTLVVPGGVGADVRMFGAIAGSPLTSDGSGHVRVRASLVVLARNQWIEIERSTAETKIRLGPRALKVREGRAETA